MASAYESDLDDLYLAKMEKFKKYEDDYTRRLMAKYFSKKNLYGGNIFDENIKIDDEIIKSSRWPCTRSYADPVKAFEDHSSSSSSTSIAENPFNNSNGKHLPKKNGLFMINSNNPSVSHTHWGNNACSQCLGFNNPSVNLEPTHKLH